MSKANPFDNHLTREDIMQSEIARLIYLQYPDLHWFHCPNEGKRTPFERYKFKKMGSRAGVSDFVIIEESNFSKGLMLEIKCGVNACTSDQVDFLIRSAEKGYTSAVVYDHPLDAFELIKDHMGSGISLPTDGIVLVKEGKRSFVPLFEAHKVLCKKDSKKSDKERVKKLFADQAKKRFGVVKESKLFQSPVK